MFINFSTVLHVLPYKSVITTTLLLSLAAVIIYKRQSPLPPQPPKLLRNFSSFDFDIDYEPQLSPPPTSSAPPTSTSPLLQPAPPPKTTKKKRWFRRKKNKSKPESSLSSSTSFLPGSPPSQAPMPGTTYIVPADFRVLKFVRVQGSITVLNNNLLDINISTTAGVTISGFNDYKWSPPHDIILADNKFGDLKRTTVTRIFLDPNDGKLTVIANWSGRFLVRNRTINLVIKLKAI